MSDNRFETEINSFFDAENPQDYRSLDPDEVIRSIFRIYNYSDTPDRRDYILRKFREKGWKRPKKGSKYLDEEVYGPLPEDIQQDILPKPKPAPAVPTIEPEPDTEL